VPVNPPTNGLAVASLILSLVGLASCITAPVGAILGHVARRQIRERGEGGEGMATAGIIVGWILTGLLLLLIAFYVVIIIFAINSDSSSTY
jgi:glycerol-3-phosphate acyltransferase PlsY